MKKFEILKTKFDKLLILKPKISTDFRGDFFRFYCSNELKKINLKSNTLQINISNSPKALTLRGLHYQIEPYSETKIVSCISGSVFDVAVDMRKKSKTYMKYFCKKISKKNNLILVIPKGFAHGYLTLEKNSSLIYLVDSKYNPKSERIFYFDDKRANIKWPKPPKFISDKDLNS